MKKVLLSVFAGAALFGGIFLLTPSGQAWLRDINFLYQKVAETSYENQRKVETSARALMSTYHSRLQQYENYKKYCEQANFDQKRCDIADGARGSTNIAVATYNEFMTQNSFIWADNIPEDLPVSLEYIND